MAAARERYIEDTRVRGLKFAEYKRSARRVVYSDITEDAYACANGMQSMCGWGLFWLRWAREIDDFFFFFFRSGGEFFFWRRMKRERLFL